MFDSLSFRLKRTRQSKVGLLLPLTISTGFMPSAPEDASARVKELPGGDLLPFIRQLPWSFVQNIINCSVDFDENNICCRIPDELKNDFDDVFNEITDEKSKSELLPIVCSVYGKNALESALRTR